MINLTYNYGDVANKNRVSSITDAATGTEGTFGFKPVTGASYTYNSAGSITADPYRGISLINYNHLNKPTEIIKTDNSKVTFTYTADGTMISKKIYNTSGTVTETRDYVVFLNCK